MTGNGLWSRMGICTKYGANDTLLFGVGQAFPFDVAQGGELVEPQPGGRANCKGVGLESPTYGLVNNPA